MTIYMLSQSRLKQASELQENVDDKTVKRAIKLAQDMYLEQILGTRLREKIESLLPTDISQGGNAVYQTLLHDYIEEVLIYRSLEELMDLITVKLMNKGAMKREAEEAQPLGREELAEIKRKYRNKADHYEDRLIRYLVANATDYPEYQDPGSSVAEIKPVKNTYTSGFCFD